MTAHPGHSLPGQAPGSCSRRAHPSRRAGSLRVTHSSPARPGHSSQREYARWRARQIAYGRWEPWADARPVRAHVHSLRKADWSYQAIAEAAGVSPMMVHRLQRGDLARGRPVPARVRASHARRLLAVTPEVLRDGGARRDACGARLRLRALTAMGHPAVSLARYLDVPPQVAWNLLGGRTSTVTHELHAAVTSLYERIWDLRPPERTGAERRAAAGARARAARSNWPPPAALDDERLDDPAYRPRARWRPATGVGVAAPPDRPTAKASGQVAGARPATQPERGRS